MISLINSLKFKFIRMVESNPRINLFLYNNISFFKPFLPHEKDYYGIKLLINNKKYDSIVDVGGNLGISAMGFRKLGFVNKIYLFEPKNFYLKNLLEDDLLKIIRMFAYNFALETKMKKKIFYPYFKKNCIHYFCSFDKNILKIV